MKKEMLINVLQPEECRIAILEDGVLEELYVERTSHESYVGNIYKGRIVNIEPSIQAAFVDFGVGRNGFLHVSDVEPAYYRHLQEREGGDRRGGGRDRDRGRGRTRVSRPNAVIPPAGDADEDEADAAGLPEEILAVGEIPADLGSAAEVTIVDEELLVEEKVEWAVDDATRVGHPDDAPGEDADETDPPPRVAEAAAAYEAGADDVSDHELSFQPFALLPSPGPGAEAPPADEAAEPEPEAGPAEAEEEPAAKPKRKPRASRAKKPRTGSRRKPPAEEAPAADEGDVGLPAEADDAEPPADEAGGDYPTADWPPEGADEDRPRPMDSAERRTRENEPSLDPLEPGPRGRGGDETGPDDYTSGGQDFSDEDLSFSMYPPAGGEPREDAGRRDERHADERHADEEPAGEEEFDRHEHHAGGREDFGHDEFDDESEFEPAEPRRGRGGRDRDRDRRGGEGRRGRGGRDRDRDRRGNGRRGGPQGRAMGRPKPLIQDIFKRGQEVLVQVIKEGIGTKGPTLSTYISIAGRYLVLMPGLNRIGVSRKITDEEQRRRLREILSELRPPKGLGFIIRTAGLDRTKKELQRDLAYLSRLWEVVVRRIKKLKSPVEIYQESDMITRTIRDTFTAEIQTIYVDEPQAFGRAQEFLQVVMPRYADRIKLYKSSVPMFHKYGIEEEIAKIHQRHVPLPDGGSIVIDQTEALVAIDVNSGNFRVDNNAEETAYRMNLLAAKEIARQLRLRDLGGVIVNDFIDMREEKHRRNVERAMRDAVRRDRARTKILKISAFGIIEMTRQRIRPSLKRSVYMDCPHCSGSGQVKTCESMSIDVMRLIQLASTRENITQIHVKVHEEVASYLHNRKRTELVRLEQETNTTIHITGVVCTSPEHLEFLCSDNNNNDIPFPPYETPKPSRRR